MSARPRLLPPVIMYARRRWYVEGTLMIPVEACSCCSWYDPQCVVATHRERAQLDNSRAPLGTFIALRDKAAPAVRQIMVCGRSA
jgi:hypothetical protein